MRHPWQYLLFAVLPALQWSSQTRSHLKACKNSKGQQGKPLYIGVYTCMAQSQACFAILLFSAYTALAGRAHVQVANELLGWAEAANRVDFPPICHSITMTYVGGGPKRDYTETFFCS